jgi:putative PIG3 family NAD(P)H quinone oxidoreductase
MMKAILLKDFGGPDMMYFGDAEIPVPGDEQVLVKVAATSVNRPDVIQRTGNYAPPKGDSEIMGLEVAGVVESLGKNVTTWKVGDRVMALIGGGGYAQYAVAYADHAMAIPDNMSFSQAACVCETYITAYLNIFMLGGLKDNQSVLLHGGGGGVNTAAIQLCKQLVPDTDVIVTASTGKVDRVRDLGADFVIDYQAESFADKVRERTNKRGVDVILDHIGGPYLEPNMKCLAVAGTLMQIGVMGGVSAELNLALAMVRRQRIIGSVLRSRPLREKAKIISEFASTVVPMLADSRIVPLIHCEFPLESAADAHRAMESSSHFGKIVLAV